MLIVPGLTAIALTFTVVNYYGSYFFELYQCPCWAYASGPAKPLLVGKWARNFHFWSSIVKYSSME